MRRILALFATLVAFGGLATTASAKPGQYTRFNESTAANGAHQYARSHMDAEHLKVTAHCRMSRYAASFFSARWVCGVDTYSGLNTHEKHAVVGVVRRDGHYEFRPYRLASVV